MRTDRDHIDALEKRVADAEAEANNAMAQVLDLEKTVTTLQLRVQRLEDLIEQLKEDD